MIGRTKEENNDQRISTDWILSCLVRADHWSLISDQYPTGGGSCKWYTVCRAAHNMPSMYFCMIGNARENFQNSVRVLYLVFPLLSGNANPPPRQTGFMDEDLFYRKKGFQSPHAATGDTSCCCRKREAVITYMNKQKCLFYIQYNTSVAKLRTVPNRSHCIEKLNFTLLSSVVYCVIHTTHKNVNHALILYIDS